MNGGSQNEYSVTTAPDPSGCAIPAAKVTPVEVKIPMAISCVQSPVPEPDWNIPHLRPEASATEKLKSALADLELSRGYIIELKAELAACE